MGILAGYISLAFTLLTWQLFLPLSDKDHQTETVAVSVYLNKCCNALKILNH